MSGFDPNALFAQAKKMKDDMARVEGELADRMVEGKATQGLVSVVINGMSEIQAVKINPEAVDLDDLSLLEDLILLAVKDGMEKAGAMKDAAMEGVTGGLGGMGGLF